MTAATTIDAPKQRDLHLEGLRGIAALMVLYCHLFAPETAIDPSYAPSPLFWTIESGHAAVALFFVISGFVIGLTNDEPCTPARIRGYAWRRFVRLIPLYVLAIAASVAVRPVDPPGAVVGNLFFLQNVLPYGAVRIPLLASNTNLWSLNYEILYYVLFVIVWRWRMSALGLMVASAVVSAIGYVHPELVPRVIASYAAGWVFWLGGLWLARDVQGRETVSREPWPALLLLFVLAWKVKILFIVMKRFGMLGDDTPGVLSLINLDFVPIAVLLVALVTRRCGRHFRLARNALLVLPLLYWSWRAANGTLWSNATDMTDAGLTLLAAGLWWWRPPLEFFERISVTGLLCYGIYVFQRPVQWFIHDHADGFQGTWLSFAVRVTVAIVMTLAVAWVAERKIQPQARRLLGAISARSSVRSQRSVAEHA